jgi:hypothetical protein
MPLISLGVNSLTRRIGLLILYQFWCGCSPPCPPNCCLRRSTSARLSVNSLDSRASRRS